jgi:CheY-like chemotaxis protein
MRLEVLASEFLAMSIKIAGHKPVVLCVEDDEDTLQMIEMMLSSKGYSILSASSVKEAVELANTHDNIHSLVTDYHIGNETATDLLNALGDRKPKNVVLLSGRQIENLKKEVPGADSHVMKPIWDPKKLIEKINVERNSVAPQPEAG